MTTSQPPRLALALLTHFVPGNESLIGDLIEEFSAGRSRAWFWRQALMTILVNARHPPVPGRGGMGPLHLGTSDADSWASPRVRSADLVATINMSGIPVAGVGGLGMVAAAVLISVVLPELWWLTLYGLLGGVVVGIAMIVSGRRLGLSGPHGGDGPASLFGPHTPDESSPGAARSDRARPRSEFAAVRL